MSDTPFSTLSSFAVRVLLVWRGFQIWQLLLFTFVCLFLERWWCINFHWTETLLLHVTDLWIAWFPSFVACLLRVRRRGLVAGIWETVAVDWVWKLSYKVVVLLLRLIIRCRLFSGAHFLKFVQVFRLNAVLFLLFLVNFFTFVLFWRTLLLFFVFLVCCLCFQSFLFLLLLFFLLLSQPLLSGILGLSFLNCLILYFTSLYPSGRVILAVQFRGKHSHSHHVCKVVHKRLILVNYLKSVIHKHLVTLYWAIFCRPSLKTRRPELIIVLDPLQEGSHWWRIG